jgi:[FeFe] hydrogenase H-cluster maturation GTPase HydF
MQKGKDQKPHIGIFGRRNAGKSSFINALSGQEIAIVSDQAGTTTDPVKKSWEITGFGPVILIDTAGIDDVGSLGLKRVEKSLGVINIIDLAILLISGNQFDEPEIRLLKMFQEQDIPFIIIHNKADLQKLTERTKEEIRDFYTREIPEIVSLKTHLTENVIQLIKQSIPEKSFKTLSLLGDLISYGDIVLLITPIDNEAPAGRLILPQVQAIRDILDNEAVAIVLKEKEVDGFLRKTGIRPALAVTDSQIFAKADGMIPSDVPLTSFSVLLARLKGDFDAYLNGTPKISELKNGDRILILESCTHHVACDDIGRIKIPRWIRNFTGKEIEFDVVAGLDKLPDDITAYAMVIQCGGCMITRKQLHNRLKPAIDAGIPVTNYGMAIAWVQGIYKRAVEPLAGKQDSSSNYL